MPVLCSAGAASVISASLALNSAACCTWASRSCLAVADSGNLLGVDAALPALHDACLLLLGKASLAGSLNFCAP